MKKTDLLAGISIFSMMEASDLDRIAHLAQYHSYNKGEVIIREGERDARLFIVVSGEVEVIKNLGTKNERPIRTLKPPSYFGEMALIDDQVRSAGVVAKQDTRVLSLEQWNLHQEIRKYPELAIHLLRMLSRRIRAIDKNLINTLRNFLPICANCKKIRDSEGSWSEIEDYIKIHTETEFTHSICPECARKLYPELNKDQ